MRRKSALLSHEQAFLLEMFAVINWLPLDSVAACRDSMTTHFFRDHRPLFLAFRRRSDSYVAKRVGGGFQSGVCV